MTHFSMGSVDFSRPKKSISTATTHPPVHPLYILPATLLCQICAGTMYMFPALVPSLTHLNLSSTQQLILVATANSGSTLGFIGGMFHVRIGSRLTAALGSFCLALTFILLQYPLPFVVCFLVVLTIVNTSYFLYSSSLALCASVFPNRFRGRVVGANCAAYAASAGVFGAFQTAFFPNDAHHMLTFCSVACFVPVAIALLMFPKVEDFDDNISSVDSELLNSKINFSFSTLWILVLSLQVAALAALQDAPQTILICAGCIIIVALLLFPIVSIGSKIVVQPCARTAKINDEPPFSEVARDIRYIYLCLGALLVIGGAGVAALVQTSSLVTARYGAPYPHLVRAFVIVFSACNMMTRLFLGGFLDIGRTSFERLMNKFNILHAGSLIMTAGLLGVGAFSSWRLYIAYGIVGGCEGLFFTAAPALTTIWFGVKSFPRNFALIGPFVALGLASLASALPGYLMKEFGTWEDGVCRGTWCTLPTFGVLAMLQVALWGFGWKVKERVRENGVAI